MKALKAIVGLSIGLMFVLNAGAQGIVASARGGYQVIGANQLRTIEFAAVRDSQNNQRGQGQLFNHVTGVKLHFVIDCLRVEGNIATMSGFINDKQDETFAGRPFWLRVVDNGEGANSPVDRTSPLITFVGPAPTCADNFFLGTFPIEGGNIQVK